MTTIYQKFTPNPLILPTPQLASTPFSSLFNCLQQQSSKYITLHPILPLQTKTFQNHITKSQHNDNQTFVLELQSNIFVQVKKMQFKQVKNNYIMASITDDLDEELEQFTIRLKNANLQQKLNIRMHMQGINKILVFVHGKSQFRLVMSHFHIGQAYLSNKCYQQAIDHFTIALKKNTKITQIKQTKIYHSYILTSLSQCYFQLQCYDDAIEILNRAYEIQQCYVNSELKINNIKTIKLISCCFLKLKNFKAAIQYIEKILPLVERLKGIHSEEYLETKFEKSIISAQEGSLQSAIEQIKNAIELLQSNSILDETRKNSLLIKYHHQLAQFQQKFGDYPAQIECYRMIQNLLSLTNKQSQLQNMLLIKKKIAIISIGQGVFNLAIKELEDILEMEIKKYGEENLMVCKSLKMLGLVHLQMGNQKYTEEYLKKCYRISKVLKVQKNQKNSIEKLLLTIKSPSFQTKITKNSHQLNIEVPAENRNSSKC